MLTRITWVLVLVGFGLLLGGFFASDANILLILAIAVELAAIVLVLASWARRAKDAADSYDEDLSFVDRAADTGDLGDDTDDDLDATFADEEFAIGGRGATRRTTSRPSGRKAGSSKPKAAARKSTTKAKRPAKAKPRTKAKPAARSAKAKPVAKAKAPSKPKAKKPAARKPTKPKPTRRRPTT